VMEIAGVRVGDAAEEGAYTSSPLLEYTAEGGLP
jgi:hypothetical protein